MAGVVWTGKGSLRGLEEGGVGRRVGFVRGRFPRRRGTYDDENRGGVLGINGEGVWKNSR